LAAPLSSAYSESPALASWRVRALCHQRLLPPHDRVESVRGALQDRDAVHLALAGVTHVLHLATCKETPDDAMDDPRRI
jgi:uncharacterized protein YbjT (DUF2867 family)